MRIAVVTPYFKEPLEKLTRCHQSVLRQTHPCDHIMVADGFPLDEIDTWKVNHIRLGQNHADYGDTPRIIGTASAATLGYDAIVLLDGDNWFEPDHIESLVKVQTETNAQVVTCPRWLRRQDGSPLDVCTESDGNVFNDTNCYLIMHPVFPIFRAWAFKDPTLGIIGDRVFWEAIKANNLSIARSAKATVNYETRFACHYWQRGEKPPENAKVIVRLTDGSHHMVSHQRYLELVADAQATRPPQ